MSEYLYAVSVLSAETLAKMKKFALLVAILTAIGGGLGALPCNSRLRIIRPNLFKHCGNNCPYGQWSSWKTVGKSVSEKCPSKKAYTQTRTSYSFIKSCPSKNETRHICKYLIS